MNDDLGQIHNLPPCATGYEESCALQARERLIRYGPGGLRDDELLAVNLGIAPGVANDLLKAVGSLPEIAKASIGQLTRVKGLGPRMAQRVKAWAELCARLDMATIPSRPIINRPMDVVPLFRKQKFADKESFMVAYLNARNAVLLVDEVCVGTIDACTLHPRDVFTNAILLNATALILAHNHPSGNLRPSESDIRLTMRMLDAAKTLGIRLLDHLIITSEGHSSLRELGHF